MEAMPLSQQIGMMWIPQGLFSTAFWEIMWELVVSELRLEIVACGIWILHVYFKTKQRLL